MRQHGPPEEAEARLSSVDHLDGAEGLTLRDPVHFRAMPTDPLPARAAGDDAFLDELAASVVVSEAILDPPVGATAHGGGVNGERYGEETSSRPQPTSIPTGVPLEARQVERLVRRVRLWSVLRVSLVFYSCLWLVTTVAGVILWRMALSGGLLDNAESFLAELLSLESFSIDGGTVLRASVIAGAVFVVAGTTMTVLLVLLFNLISELTGGIRLAVVELETARPVTTDDLPGGRLPARWARRATARSGSPAADRVR